MTSQTPSSPSVLQSRRNFLATAVGAVAAAGALAAGNMARAAANPAAPQAFPDLGAAPDFTGIERWLNSEPLTLANLRGRVVVVDFWTYACINCVRTLPYINRWAAQYTPQGLTVVGVHTPEFPFERSVGNVEAAMRRYGVKHPVAQDNGYRTWKAYNNQYWPATYLIDAQGRIRYKHFGEGEYERTEGVIRSLLAMRSGSA